MNRQALYFTAPRTVALRTEPLPALQPEQLLVETHFSAVSAGTELLLYRGQAPAAMATDATIAALGGTLAYPLKYGYAAVGRVIATGGAVTDWQGRHVFAFNPHESHFITEPSAVLPVPDGLPLDAAALLPTLETAVSFVMDGQPVIGERVAVIGQGMVGLLTTFLLAQFPLAQLVTVDGVAARRRISAELHAHDTYAPADWFTSDSAQAANDGQFDLVYELSGNPTALNQAIAACRYSGRIVVGSWYGNKTAPITLGAAFHRRHLRLISSQVSTLAPQWRGRWDSARRMGVAWQQLRRLPSDKLITHRVPFSQAADAYAQLDGNSAEILQLLFTYR
jgi:2-desacetyl-2-hydroxyethyl bacteriochlorophyllide A dehydrogenase